jgi:hypothetical protein
MGTALKYATALLGLWLVVAVSVFPAGAALWLAFATAVAITAAAIADAAVGLAARRALATGTATATAALGAFLVVASLVFPGISMEWAMAIGGAVVISLALGAAAPSGRGAEEALSLPSPRHEGALREKARLGA